MTITGNRIVLYTLSLVNTGMDDSILYCLLAAMMLSVSVPSYDTGAASGADGQ